MAPAATAVVAPLPMPEGGTKTFGTWRMVWGATLVMGLCTTLPFTFLAQARETQARDLSQLVDENVAAAVTLLKTQNSSGQGRHLLFKVGAWALYLYVMNEQGDLACAAQTGSDAENFWMWLYQDGLLQLGIAAEDIPRDLPQSSPEAQVQIALGWQIDGNEPWLSDEIWVDKGEIGFPVETVELTTAFFAELREGRRLSLLSPTGETIRSYDLTGADVVVDGLLACLKSLKNTQTRLE